MDFLRMFGSILLAASVLLACSAKQTQKAVARATSQETATPKILDSYFSGQFPPNEPGGAVLAMIGDSIVFSKGYGLSDMESKEAVTTKTLFNTGSISKTFVANAILILRDQGKLSLEDDLLKYFPDFKNPKVVQKIKLKHLLTHTSGLPDIRYLFKDSVFYLTAKDAENWAPIMKATQLNFAPGARYEYSNPAFNALALIVEKVSGMKWQKFVSEKIFKPSGMNSSTITDGQHPSKGVAHAYIKAQGKWIEKDYGEEPTFAAAGNGGVWSSVEELATYELALRQSIFLKPESIQESREIKTFSEWASGVPPKIGWSWFMDKTIDGFITIGHTGSQGGFRANYVSVPEKKWFIVILSSTPRPLEEQTLRVLEYLKTGN